MPDYRQALALFSTLLIVVVMVGHGLFDPQPTMGPVEFQLYEESPEIEGGGEFGQGYYMVITIETITSGVLHIDATYTFLNKGSIISSDSFTYYYELQEPGSYEVEGKINRFIMEYWGEGVVKGTYELEFADQIVAPGLDYLVPLLIFLTMVVLNVIIAKDLNLDEIEDL